MSSVALPFTDYLWIFEKQILHISQNTFLLHTTPV